MARTFATDAKRTDRRVRFDKSGEGAYFCYGAGETRTIFYGLVDGKYIDFVKYNGDIVPLDKFIRSRACYRIERKSKNGN